MIKTNNTDTKILQHNIIMCALEQKDKPYQHGAHGPDSFDCAGLVWYVFNKVLELDIYDNGFGLSTTTKIMTNNIGDLNLFDESEPDKDLSSLNSGDILFFHRQSMSEFSPTPENKYPGHCGIYLGNNKFIHAPRSKGKVIISDFTKNAYWAKVLVGSKNILSSYNKAKSKILNR